LGSLTESSADILKRRRFLTKYTDDQYTDQ
jgi:hypothetical protein